ncbi:MAG: GAK system ATP-grasp enzyme [Desulfococcaceae bacterium]
MPKIGVVGTPGGWSSEWLADAAAKRTGYRLLIDLAKVSLDLGSGILWFEDVELNKLDALILKKAGARYSPALLDRLELLRAINERGLPMFSKPYSILRVLDRLSCTVTLANGGIPMPPTTITEDVEAALLAVEDYGESVFKPLYSTKARGMMVVSAGPKARPLVEQFHREFGIMYIQQKLDIGDQDLGVVFLGGEYLTTYARCKTGDSWNTTTRSGGKYQAYEPSAETVELARKAQALFDLDFTCVDVAETANGPLVFEVSAFGGFRGIQTASNMDAAELYIDYVLQKI